MTGAASRHRCLGRLRRPRLELALACREFDSLRNIGQIKKGPDGTLFHLSGAPGEIRTPDLLVRSQTLYPTELRARFSETVCELWRRGRDDRPPAAARSLRRLRRLRVEPGLYLLRGLESRETFTQKSWRRGRDSNPRRGFKPLTPLAGERFRPLSHLSYSHPNPASISQVEQRSGLLVAALLALRAAVASRRRSLAPLRGPRVEPSKGV
jgi:hypothetical protein